MNYVLELIVILMLTATILFCWRLNSKIIELRGSRKDMANLVQVFDAAVANTQTSMRALKETALETAGELRKQSVRSYDLVKELAFMNETGAKIIEQLEALMFEAREIEKKCSVLLEKAIVLKGAKKGAAVSSETAIKSEGSAGRKVRSSRAVGVRASKKVLGNAGAVASESNAAVNKR